MRRTLVPRPTGAMFQAAVAAFVLRLVRGVLPVLHATLLLLACKADLVARLERSSGTVECERAAAGAWKKAERGATFSIGDAIQTRAASRAELVFFDESKLALEPNTRIRFSSKVTGSKRPRMDLEFGEATFESGDDAVSLAMAVGVAMLEPHTKVRLLRAGAATRFEVIIGSARLLSEAEALELRIGNAVDIQPDHSFEPVSSMLAPPAPPAAAAGTSAPSGAAVGEDGAPRAAEDGVPQAALAEDGGAPEPTARLRPRGPELVDFAAAAGDSFVIHDPKPPTAIALTQSQCADGAILTLDPQRAKPIETDGGQRLSVEVPAGSHRYVIHCKNSDGSKGQQVARGSVSVVADSGSRSLPKSAPSSQVDADGRSYTVLYQSTLPEVVVRWPRAPEADGYTLHVRSSKGARSFPSKAASYRLASGSLPEGEHVVFFEGAGRRSQATTVALRFDNAAPTASISSPANGGFARGGTVRVEGVALPGWTVSVAGRELSQDAQNRFSEDVTAPGDCRSLWIRFAHPQRGAHYYLRRSAD